LRSMDAENEIATRLVDFVIQLNRKFESDQGDLSVSGRRQRGRTKLWRVELCTRLPTWYKFLHLTVIHLCECNPLSYPTRHLNFGGSSKNAKNGSIGDAIQHIPLLTPPFNFFQTDVLNDP
jgi:hypothetical protein